MSLKRPRPRCTVATEKFTSYGSKSELQKGHFSALAKETKFERADF